MEELKMPVILKYGSNMKTISNIGLERVLSELLDISKTHHDLAVTRYKDIGNWLDQDNCVASYSPQIYPQGSFRLGTVTKSISKEDDYDLDFVIELERPGENITPWGLKRLVGDAIKAYVSDNYMVSLQEEGRRCWTLNYRDYSENVKFHMDVLPAIPATTTPYQDELEKLKHHRSAAIGQKLEVASNVKESAIAITDKPPDSRYVWLLSNPRGYGEWFKKMSFKIDPIVTLNVESAPDHQSKKSPLQRVVQLLKRHRDLWIDRQTVYSKDDKPISIIITTLAAKAYRYDVNANETNILQALQAVVEKMCSYIEDGDLVRNPVNEHENFADKWETHPQRKECFCAWHKQVDDDLNSLNSVLNRRYVSDDMVWEWLALFLGEKVVNQARERSM